MQRIGNFGAKALFFLLPFMGVVFTRLIFNFDFWFILNSGRYVMEHGFPYTEPFTMHEGLNFVLEQWASDVIFWEIFSNFGAEAVLTFVILIGFCILFLYEKTCFFLSDNASVSKVLTVFFGTITVQLFFVTRPQIISILIFIIEVFLLLNYAKTNLKKYLYFIPILSFITVNFHSALWPMIFILMLPFIATFFVGKLTNLDEEYLGKKFDVLPIFYSAVLSFLIAFLNPYGSRAMMFLFTSFDPNIHGAISEIQPMMLSVKYNFFSFAYSAFFFISLFFGAALMAKKKMPIYLILLFWGLGFLAMLASRNLIFFNLISTFIFAYGLKDYEFKLGKLRWTFLHYVPFLIVEGYLIYKLVLNGELYNMPLIYIMYFLLLFFALIAFVLFYNKDDKLKNLKGLLAVLVPFFFIAHLSFHNDASAKDYIGEQYKDSVEILLAKNDAKDIRLFTGFNTGAYPEYRGIKCYIDARPEVFAPKNSGKSFSIIGEYFDVADGKIYYRDFVKKYDFNYMLVEEGDGVLFVMLPHDDDFTLLYEEKDDNGKVHARLYKVNINE